MQTNEERAAAEEGNGGEKNARAQIAQAMPILGETQVAPATNAKPPQQRPEQGERAD